MVCHVIVHQTLPGNVHVTPYCSEDPILSTMVKAYTHTNDVVYNTTFSVFIFTYIATEGRIHKNNKHVIIKGRKLYRKTGCSGGVPWEWLKLDMSARPCRELLPFSLLLPLSLSPSIPFFSALFLCSLLPLQFILMRRILPSKKSKKRPGDLKIPIPLVGGVYNANLTDNQIDQLLTGRRHDNSLSTATNDHHHKKASSIAEERSNAYEEKPPPRPISSPPILAMPNPRRPFAPKDSVLQCPEYDKTQIENSTITTNTTTPPPLSAESNNSDQQSVLVLLPQNWKEIPNHIQREQIMAAPERPMLMDDSEQWAESSEDSNLQYTSAPQSPLVSDDDPSSTALSFNHQYKHHHLSSDSSTPRAHRHQRVANNIRQPPPIIQPTMAPSQRPPAAAPEHNVISLEALKRQVDMIQQQRELERREWERREMEHRQREQVMLDKIMDTQRQLERALAASSNSSNSSSSNRRRNITIRPLPRDHDDDDDDDSDSSIAAAPERIRRSQRRRSAPGSPQYHSAVEEDHLDQDDPMASFPRRRAAAAAARRSSIRDDTAAAYMSLPGPHHHHHHRLRRPHHHHPSATTTTIMHLHPPPPIRPPPHATPAGGPPPPPPPPLLYDEWAAAAAVGWGGPPPPPPPHYPIAPPFSESAYQDEPALYRSYNRRSLRQQQQQQAPGSTRIQHRRPSGYHTFVDGPPSLGY